MEYFKRLKDLIKVMVCGELYRLLEIVQDKGLDCNMFHCICSIDKSDNAKQSVLDFETEIVNRNVSLEDFLLMVYLCGGRIVYDDKEEA